MIYYERVSYSSGDFTKYNRFRWLNLNKNHFTINFLVINIDSYMAYVFWRRSSDGLERRIHSPQVPGSIPGVASLQPIELQQLAV